MKKRTYIKVKTTYGQRPFTDCMLAAVKAKAANMLG